MHEAVIVEQDIARDESKLRKAWESDQGATLYTGQVLYELREKYMRPDGLRRVSDCELAVRSFKDIYTNVGIPERTVYDRIARHEESIGLREVADDLAPVPVQPGWTAGDKKAKVCLPK